jgi:hypothetical protein
MDSGIAVNMIVMYFIISIFFYAAILPGTTPIPLNSDLNRFVTVSGNDTWGNQSIIAANNSALYMGIANTNTSSGGIPGLITGIGATIYNGITLGWSALLLFSQIVFAPLTVMANTGAPIPIQLIFGAIPFIILIYAIFCFIVGRDL